MTALRGVPADFGYAPAREARLASRRALERAQLTTCLLATAVFVACWLARGLLPSQPYAIPVAPAGAEGHDMIKVDSRPNAAPAVAPAAPQPASVPLPVPDEMLVPADDPAPVVTGGRDAPALPGLPGGGWESVGPGPDVPSTPEPGIPLFVEQLPEVTFRVRPEYPDLAREAQVAGTVHLWALVGLGGAVEEVRVQRSVPLLDAAAVAAVARWRFTPALNNGRPVRVWVAVPVRFSLH